MSKPEDIPEEVLVAARRAALPQYVSDLRSSGRITRGEADHWPIVRVAIRAILAERERCAFVALEIAQEAEDGEYYIAHRIAAAIRKRGEG